MRRAIAAPPIWTIVLLFFAALSSGAYPQTSSGVLTALTDDATGVRIAVPSDLMSRETSTGRRWTDAQGDIDVETMVFRTGTLRERHDSIASKPGRAITKDELVEGVRFVVEGREPAPSARSKLFHIEMYARDGEIHGLSVDYTDANPALARTAQAIIQSFEPFPAKSVTSAPVATAPILPPPPPVAAELLVLGASGIRGVAVGDRLPDDHVFKLPTHSELRLLKSPDNSSYVMRGPYEGTLSSFIEKCSGLLAPTRSYCKDSDEASQPLGGTRGPREAPPAATSKPAAPSFPNPCDTRCTPVTIFYGTDRTRKDTPKRIAYDFNRAGRLELGRAVVTVPRSVKRNPGEIVLPTWWEITFRGVPPEGDPSKHFVIFGQGFKVFKSEDDFLADVRAFMAGDARFKKEAFIFLHGYNTSFDDALFRTAQLAYDLGQQKPDGSVEPFGTAFMYSWPSGGALADYLYDAESSRLAIDYLRSFIQLVADRTGAEHVHIIAHSMGNFALLHALEQMAEHAASKSKVEQVILAAPDIDAKEFRDIAEKISRVAKGYTLYASSNDVAMIASREVHKGSPRAGDVPVDGPIVVSAVDSIDVSRVSMAYFSIHHNDYVEEKDLLNDVANLLRTGTHPPNERSAQFLRLGLPGHIYWRYGQ